MSIKITGTGSYIPLLTKKNDDFLTAEFLNEDGSEFKVDNEIIIKKFESITGIEERRYAKDHHNTSDLAFFAAEKAIKDAALDQETIDYIIVAHNFGDIKSGTKQSDSLPSLASRVKFNLGIKNPNCVCYDIIFGCPGWIEGVIQAYAFIKAGMAKKCLVIGAETLSRTYDIKDRDSMIYADGAGASIVELKPDDKNNGILSHKSCTFTDKEAFYLFFGKTYDSKSKSKTKYIKMYGRKVYEFAIVQVPQALKECLELTNYSIHDVKKVFLHQANEKMDEAIVNRFYKLYNLKTPKNVLPMSIKKLGNSSVATIPTLFDLVNKLKLKDHSLQKGDIIMFGSVGAGMNINAITYKI
ncbi:ketoacyl-ACP synthase III [Flavobacteriaceae bacterium]|nr:ketoacyl-ACP synthase III [Flavobacteriaceae bacterium]MDA9213298.1 ketoacyl-ACP synthase III [Flavobacteriaceae bacterium]MDA9373506.1 ketoacyl-ACP synthase III [Flavobacteriaceae bacterium]MDB4005968.1 ketoacyl-ACP synthase III [Flavobacteriaceae bacterium]MDB4014239.1 ketoacyl-ACP synthase III [Flavobacteriaceae bacterium]